MRHFADNKTGVSGVHSHSSHTGMIQIMPSSEIALAVPATGTDWIFQARMS